MVDPVFISVRYQPEEVNNGYWSVHKDVVMPRDLLTIFSFTFGLPVFCILVFVLTHNTPTSSSPLETLIGFLALLAPIVMPIASTLVIWILAKQNAMESYSRRPVFHLPMTFILSENGLKVTSTGGSGTIDWKHLPIGLETDESFCVGSSANEIFILPKRAFASATEVKAVRGLLKGHIANYKHVGKGRADSSITYEKQEVLSITIDGKEYKKESKAEALAANKNASADQAAEGEALSVADQPYSFDAEEVNAAEILASEPPLSAVLSGEAEGEKENSTVVDLQGSSGLAIEVVYRVEEIVDAEKIHFFRKKLPLLAKAYLFHALLIPLAFFTVGYIADGLDLTMGLLRQYGPWFVLYVPILLIHAFVLFKTIMRRIAEDKSLTKPLTFQLTEESCGLRMGEKYSVVTWWHFQECWETELEYILLYGAQGRAMWVIPKRSFPDRMALAYGNELLKRKIANYKDLA